MHDQGRRHRLVTDRRPAVTGVLGVVAALLLSGCVSTAKGEAAMDPVSREQMTQTLTASARDAVAATGFELTYANITYSSCAADGFSAPSYGMINAGFGIPDTTAEAEAQIDAWAPELVAAGWTQTPSDTSQDVQVQDRIFAKNGIALFLTPWATSYAQPPNVFTLRSECTVDTDGRPRPEDADLLPAITGK